ncbi:p21-activated protein kinase-interacting protein 1-like [Anopheles cruzii]|uniref:p21-activated protein kinase-interacting protein 1-like n=1 Tax=Anopheles cruzii TaxID=68878 RepID=UPI0022EC1BE3|nr:p21-activated protein kinase-interacting protein 1-like [Anopheles cruzii]
MAGMEIVVGTYEQFTVCYRAEPSKKDPSKLYFKEAFAAHLHTSSVRSMASHGKYIATGGADDRICLLDVERGTQITEFLHHDGTINAVAFAKDGSHLFAGCSDGDMSAISMGRLTVTRTWKNAHKAAVQSISIHPQGTLALTLGTDMTLKTWDLVAGRTLFTTALRTNTKYGNTVSDVQWSPDGDHFSILGARVVDVISVETTHSVRTVKCDAKPTAICWLSDDEIAVGLETGHLLLFNIHNDEQQEQLPIYDTRVKAIASNGCFIATASSAGDISLWRLEGSDFTEICTQQSGCRPICLVLRSTESSKRTDAGPSKTAAVEEATEPRAVKMAAIATKVARDLARVVVETEDPVELAAVQRKRKRLNEKGKKLKQMKMKATGMKKKEKNKKQK